MVSSPKPPDPYETAAAQAGANRDTAMTQQLMNMINQQNPWGSTEYTPSGSTTFTDAQGRQVTVPQYTQTTTFSPEQQEIFDQTQAAQSNLAGIAQEQSGRISELMSQPFEFGNQDAADWAYDIASSRILPQQQQAEAALRTRLVNAGLRPGTEAYERELTRSTQGNQDQLNQLALAGREMAFGEALATRNQPINELTALLSGSQVSNPAAQSGPTPQTSVAGTDIAGLIQQDYQSRLQNSQSMMGGLFGLAGSLGSAAIPFIPSDRRVKIDTEQIGRLDNGLPVYTFRYRWGGPMQIGLMAQDVQEVHPDAVHDIDGVLAVDYGKAVR